LRRRKKNAARATAAFFKATYFINEYAREIYEKTDASFNISARRKRKGIGAKGTGKTKKLLARQ
jgi:hypothetical protein